MTFTIILLFYIEAVLLCAIQNPALVKEHAEPGDFLRSLLRSIVGFAGTDHTLHLLSSLLSFLRKRRSVGWHSIIVLLVRQSERRRGVPCLPAR